MVWECPANQELECYERTRYLQAKAPRGVEELPCLWLRGVVPATWLPTLPPLPA